MCSVDDKVAKQASNAINSLVYTVDKVCSHDIFHRNVNEIRNDMM